MPTKIQHHPLNWVNGMKISKEHLISLENSYIDHCRDALGVMLTDFSFGLLPMSSGLTDPFLIEINEERIELLRCQAVTRSGINIFINDDFRIAELRKPMREIFPDSSARTAEWYVVLRVNPFKRMPFGQPNPEEFPIRHPHAISSYELSILPKEQLNVQYFDEFSIPLARIIDDYGGKKRDDSYIPPCTSMFSVKALSEKYARFGKWIDEIEQNLIEIVKRIHHKHQKGEGNVLSQDVKIIAEKFLDFICATKARYSLSLEYLPPIYTVEHFVSLAHILNASLRFLNNKEGMLKYFNFYIKDSNPVLLQTLIDNLRSLKYNHFDILASIQLIEDFLNFFQILFDRLKELQLREFLSPTIIDNTTISNFPSPHSKKGNPDDDIVVRPRQRLTNKPDKSDPSEEPRGRFKLDED